MSGNRERIAMSAFDDRRDDLGSQHRIKLDLIEVRVTIVIDDRPSFFWRAGDAFSALLVFVGTALAFDMRRFAMVNALLVLIWLGVAFAIARLRKEQAARPEMRIAA